MWCVLTFQWNHQRHSALQSSDKPLQYTTQIYRGIQLLFSWRDWPPHSLTRSGSQLQILCLLLIPGSSIESSLKLAKSYLCQRLIYVHCTSQKHSNVITAGPILILIMNSGLTYLSIYIYISVKCNPCNGTSLAFFTVQCRPMQVFWGQDLLASKKISNFWSIYAMRLKLLVAYSIIIEQFKVASRN